MKSLYTFCWFMICIGVLMIFGTLGYDILVLETLTVEGARTAADVKRDTWLVLVGAGITTSSALTGMIVGFFVKPTVTSSETPEQAN